MKIIRKWNYDTRQYDPYEVPEDWNIPLYCEDLETVINCVNCGEKVLYGDCFTSLVLHSAHGLGYAVCPECHEKEIKEYFWRKNKK